MKTRAGWEPGTRTKLYCDFGADHPEVGDQVGTPAGASYLVLSIRRSPSRPYRWYLDVERLPYGSVDLSAEGVWGLRWYPRRRRVRPPT